MEKKHFVLVHGAGHGAWCWYKLLHELKSAGYEVTALDLGSSGIDPKQLDDIPTISSYIQPLLDFLESLHHDEKIVLVGHSFGGFSISLAMESFPDKIMVAVCVSAYMPNHVAPTGSILHEFSKLRPGESLLDCKFTSVNGSGGRRTYFSFGPLHLAKLYLNTPPQDLELAKTLVRPHWLFNLSEGFVLTEAKFGSVDRAFVICGEDRAVDEELQQWMIDNSPPKQVRYINGAGHMAMLSKPKQLSQCLQEIVGSYD